MTRITVHTLRPCTVMTKKIEVLVEGGWLVAMLQVLETPGPAAAELERVLRRDGDRAEAWIPINIAEEGLTEAQLVRTPSAGSRVSRGAAKRCARQRERGGLLDRLLSAAGRLALAFSAPPHHAHLARSNDRFSRTRAFALPLFPSPRLRMGCRRSSTWRR